MSPTFNERLMQAAVAVQILADEACQGGELLIGFNIACTAADLRGLALKKPTQPEPKET